TGMAVGDRAKVFLQDDLGFNKSLLEFVYPDLFVGALMAFWIYLVYFFASGQMFIVRGKKFVLFKPKFIRQDRGEAAASSAYQSGWLGFLGDRLWKLIPLAVAYAILMQIPVVSGVIGFMVFDFARDGWFYDVFIRSILMSFYVALLPSGIEEFVRYRLRKKYYRRVVQLKYDRAKLSKL
ncbi:hypothetical protein GOV14_05885, partial [Candidatus Pacearchaeota archaeon]|nr:hypothetical protein [Candidatus Pacearchaeota archaeon]